MKAFKAFNDSYDEERMRDEYFFKILQTMGNPFTAEEIRQLKWLIHKDDGPNASGEDFIIENFVKMLYAPKPEPEET
ncbi:hypothetical protein TRFO_03271 [Tritrichomonas foetus]|uniref:Uncharacterized protein n=1 Tax=Tritrichomonas foetus TaxID=1144522 RepID=A0A1J4KQL4_9EUKA|nr:hypothetical protein TRFO_03271 [Tritrichomonas foetus]|eukprot:OHT13539.1 hypothetical protein TRFO_03271 [Tritrichomonas foetus]